MLHINVFGAVVWLVLPCFMLCEVIDYHLVCLETLAVNPYPPGKAAFNRAKGILRRDLAMRFSSSSVNSILTLAEPTTGELL